MTPAGICAWWQTDRTRECLGEMGLIGVAQPVGEVCQVDSVARGQHISGVL